jgi:acetylornithine/N-succinyldiaminopimelate aminotransferase
MTNEPALRLAATDRRDLRRARVLLQPGAEANEAAFKLARRYAHDRYGPERDPRDLDLERVPRPHADDGHRRWAGEVLVGFGPNPVGFMHIPYNDIAALEAAFRDEGGDDIWR